MRGIFGSDSRLMKVLGKIFDIGYLSIVFIIFSLPVVTIGASLTALYYAVVKVIRRDRGYVFQEFFRSFKLNFVKATILWLIQAVLTFVMCFNLYAVVEQNGGTIGFMQGAYIVMGLIIFAISCYAYPVLSRFDMKNTKIIRFSLYMAVKHVYFTIPIMVIVLASIISSCAAYSVYAYYTAACTGDCRTCMLIYDGVDSEKIYAERGKSFRGRRSYYRVVQ